VFTVRDQEGPVLSIIRAALIASMLVTPAVAFAGAPAKPAATAKKTTKHTKASAKHARHIKKPAKKASKATAKG
jgi:hypothetical protein